MGKTGGSRGSHHFKYTAWTSFNNTQIKGWMIQRTFAWSLGNDDTQIVEALFHIITKKEISNYQCRLWDMANRTGNCGNKVCADEGRDKRV